MGGRRGAAQVVEAGAALLFTWWVWRLPDAAYTRWVVEDGYLEWLQVGALVAAFAAAVVGVRRAASSSLGRWAWVAGTAVLFVAVGEELAWGSRLLTLSVSSVEAANVQGDLTLHNLGGLRGLSKTFGALSFVGFAGAVAMVVRRRIGLAVWFVLPAVYCAFRVLDNDPITSRLAKLSEVLELVLYVALARVVAELALHRRPASMVSPAATGESEAVIGLGA